MLCPQKPLVFATKTSLVRSTFYCPQKPPFHVQKPFFCTSLSLLLSKATLFHPPLSISTTLNLLFAKNTAVLLIFALNPYAVKPEHRTDSKPLRRRFAGKTGFGTSRRKTLQTHFRQSFESLPGVQRFANLWCTFGSFRTSEKHEKRSFRRELRGSANLESAHKNNNFAQSN